MIIFSDNEDALECDNSIKNLRAQLNLESNYEFHFSESSKKAKEKFFNLISTFNFFYLTITINKANLYGEGFKYPKSFYKYTCNLVFENAKPYINNATVIIDGSGSRKFKLELQSYLKKKINEKDSIKIKKVKIQQSHKNNLLQLADMVCGAITYSIKGKKDNNKYRRMISHREIYCQFWPKYNN
ncbi:MAG: DUF3800 domain-containing protein [Ignavibacteriae bacterium]|nr:DUF3800 domain-containing protein [Ignavibacteriota bacterium]NOG98811.1 DUF3800 domain-containing protein [Ignavibacteriota bacterium]